MGPRKFQGNLGWSKIIPIGQINGFAFLFLFGTIKFGREGTSPHSGGELGVTAALTVTKDLNPFLPPTLRDYFSLIQLGFWQLLKAT